MILLNHDALISCIGLDVTNTIMFSMNSPVIKEYSKFGMTAFCLFPVMTILFFVDFLQFHSIWLIHQVHL